MAARSLSVQLVVDSLLTDGNRMFTGFCGYRMATRKDFTRRKGLYGKTEAKVCR
jgi:hypothetical protein